MVFFVPRKTVKTHYVVEVIPFTKTVFVLVLVVAFSLLSFSGLSDYSIFDVLEDEVDNMMDLNQEEEEREEEREEPIFKIKEM